MKLLSILLAGFIITLSAGSAEANGGGIPEEAAKVRTGLDVMVEKNFEPLQGRKVGLITNHSGISQEGRQNLDLMLEAGIDVKAIFSPEHGFRGDTDTHVDSSIDEATGLPIYSLYAGPDRRPAEEHLEGLDALVFDIQDIGARFYTYISTMGMCMEVAKERDMLFVVLDRPNPIRGDWFDGPIQEDDLVGRFTSFRHMPVVHGMTVGEMAKFYENHSGRMHDEPGIGLGDNLVIAEMEGWKRDMYFDETGLPWVNPSPNMRSVMEELLYTMVALAEANKTVSVGRGTDRPFEYLGAPWIDGEALTQNLRDRELPGIWVMKTTFMPRTIDVSGRKNYPYQFNDEVCQGVRFVVTDRGAISPVESGIHMLAALYEVGGERYQKEFHRLRGLVGAQWVLDAVEAGEDPSAIAEQWRNSPEFKAFADARESVLIYE